MRLRLAQISDLEAIVQIEQEAFGNPWPHDAYVQELEREYGRVEVAEAPIVGVVGFSCTWHVLDEAHLMRIAVRASHQRCGWGVRLLESVVGAARRAGCIEVSLEVAASNTAALGLYKRARFEETGRRLGYYRLPVDDAVLMRCRL